MSFQSLISDAKTIVSRRDFFGTLFVIVAALSGKLAATKLSGGHVPTWLLEVRFWSTLLGAYCLFPFVRSLRWNPNNKLVFGSILVLVTYLLARSPFGATDLTAAKVLDLVYLVIFCFLMLIVLSENGRTLLAGGAILAIAGALFLIAAAVVLANPDPNIKWAAIGGPLTFYRLEFLGFCCAFWMFGERRGNPALSLLLMTAMLFGTLASLSKGAYLGALIVNFGLICAAGFLKKWREMVTIAAVTSIVFASWNINIGSAFYKRTNQAYAVDDSALQPRNIVAKIINEFPPKKGTEAEAEMLSQLAPGFSYKIAFSWCSLDGSNSRKEQPTSSSCHSKSIFDRTQRLVFAAKSLETVSLFGHGVASFLLWSVNPGAGYELEAYTYPHNVALELLYEGGLFALILFLAAIGLCVRSLLKLESRDAGFLAFAGFGAFIFFSSMLSGDFYDFRLFWIAALAWSTCAVPLKGFESGHRFAGPEEIDVKPFDRPEPSPEHVC